MFDAYTVKKVLPRLLIAVILIQLSWPLFTLMIVVVSNIAWGLEGLLYAPFGGRDALEIGMILEKATGTAGLTLTGIFGGAAVIGGAAFALGGSVGILLLAASTLLALVIAFFVLAIRQVLIVVLLVTAPLALVAWILPSTDKLWKIWWESFSKVLLMYPLILLIVAGGRIAAMIAATGTMNMGNGMFQIGIILLAFFGPYFLIPKTAQVAGSAFANIAGIANNRSRGAFDRLRNARQNRAKQLHEDRMASKTWLGSGKTGSLYRRGVAMGANGSLSPFSRGRNRWKEMEALRREQSADELLEKGGGRAFNDDDASALLMQKGMTKDKFIDSYAHKMITDGRASNEKEAKTMAQRALGRAETAVGAKAGSAAMRVAAQKFRTSMTNTAYDPGVAGLEALQRDLVALQEDGLITDVDAAGWLKGNKGRGDFSANGFVPTVDFAAGRATAASQLSGAFKGADPREIVGGHQRAVESFAQVARQNFDQAVAAADAAQASGDQTAIYEAEKQLDVASADLAGIYDTLANISPKKAQVFADQVFERGLVSRGKTVRALMEERRSRPPDANGNQPFLDRRREWRNAAEEQGARQQMAQMGGEGDGFS